MARAATLRTRLGGLARGTHRGIETALLRAGSIPPLWRHEVEVSDPNTIFSQRRRRELRGHVQRLAHRDAYMRERLSERRIGGVRDWEYGTLLGLLRTYPDRATWSALDVGSGNSTFPGYLVTSGNVGTMTTLDLPSAHEPQTDRNLSADLSIGVRRVEGSMLELPFGDETFDLVTCVSAIEHLEGDRFADEQPSHDEFVARTQTALRELVRVLKPGGLVFVTSEAYMPELQRTDAWSSPDGSGPIWNAYPYEDIERVFVATVSRSGAELIGQPDFRSTTLIGSPDRANFRGRYFTTFCIAARKVG